MYSVFRGKLYISLQEDDKAKKAAAKKASVMKAKKAGEEKPKRASEKKAGTAKAAKGSQVISSFVSDPIRP